MVAVRPFSGQLVKPERVGEVVSPAYDALTIEQRRAYRVEHPLCYLHVTRSAPDEDDAETVDNTTLVTRGRAALERLLDAEVFAEAGVPTFLVYELETADHRQRGVVCEVPGHEFRRSAKPHEATQPARAALLAEHFTTVRAASSPVACTLGDGAALDTALAVVDDRRPEISHDSGDGLVQRVWRISSDEENAAISAAVGDQALYIIDGHHRAAANGQLLDRGIDVPLLVTVFSAEALQLTGFHRLLRLPEGIAEAHFIQRVARRFATTPIADVRPPAPGTVVLGSSDGWYEVQFDERPVTGSPLVRLGSLDPSVVEREIIGLIASNLEGGADVSYMPDEGDLAAVASEARRDGRVAILVPPVTVADMIEVADGGLTMPAKSTYFTPKVRSGLFLRRYDDLLGSP